MKRLFKFIFLILAVLSYVLLLFMAWPLSGFDLSMQPYVNTWYYLGIAAAVILGLFVLWQIIALMRKGQQRELTEQRDGGTVRIVSGAIATTAVNAARSYDEVKTVTAEVKQAGKDAAIDLKMKVDVLSSALNGASIKSLAENIKQKVSREVEAFSGYPIHNFDIQIDVEDVTESRDRQEPAPVEHADLPNVPLQTEVMAEPLESQLDRPLRTESSGVRTFVETEERSIELPEETLTSKIADEDDRDRDFVLKK